MNQEITTELLFQIIGEQHIAIRMMNEKLRQLTEQLTEKDKDEDTKDS